MLPLLRLKIKQLRNNAAAFAGCAVLTTGMLCSAGRTAKAQTSFPMIMSTFPAGVQRGKTTDVTITSGVQNGGGGNNLYGAYRAMFEGEGIKAEIIPPEKGWPAKDPKSPFAVPSVPSVTMRVTVAADAPLGVREFRVATPHHGSSTVGLLVIGDEPETLETEPNNDKEHAQQIPVPCVVNGKIQAAEDVDVYKFTAAAGQELTFAVQCARLEDKIHDIDPHADPLIVIKDTAGHELARNDDFYRADPMVHCSFPAAGTYYAEVRDVGYKGNPNWVYRLNVTNRPYVVSTVPCAVRRGQSAELNVVGYGLAGGKTAHVDVPPSVPTGIWYTTLKLPNGTSNLVGLVVTDAPQAASVPTPGGASKTGPTVKGALTLPGGVNSWIDAAGIPDRYSFHAKKGESWGFEVTARRIDSEMDSEIKIRDAKGNVLAANDDALGKDSRLDWSAPADGDYTIDIRDLAGHAGPTYFYNLTAQRLAPDFRIRYDTDRGMIAPGNRTAWFMMIERKYGFGGEVKIDVSGLPAGVTASPLTLPANITQGAVIFTAAPGAKVDMGLVKVTGTAMLPGADGKPAAVTRTAIPLTEIYLPGGGRGVYEVETSAMAVSEQNDISVSVANPNITIAPGGTAKIEVTIERRPDYRKPVTLDLRVNHLGGVHTNQLPPGITVEADAVTIPENQNKGVITIKAAPDAAAIQNWNLAVMANVSVNFVMKVWYVAPVSLTVTGKK
jgi:hypothetical protein